MALSNDLISQFVKATNDVKSQKSQNNIPTVTYGTVVYDGKTYVKIDGSDLLTPVSSTVTTTHGDRVTVQIQNHTAVITGNLTDKSASEKNVDKLTDEISEFENIVSYRVTAEELNATKATIDSLNATVATLSEASILEAEIAKLEAMYAELDKVKAGDVEALNAQIEYLEAEIAKFTDISTEDLEAINADIQQLKAYNGEFTYVSADRLKAMQAEIDNLDVGGLTAEEADIRYAKIAELDALEAEFERLEADSITGGNLEVINGKIENLETTIFDAESGDIKFANIDFSNIGEAAVTKLFAESGIIDDLVVKDGNITGTLVGVTITGDVIDANTIKADSLMIQGKDGLYYKLNVEAGITTSEEVSEEDLQNGLSGKVLVAKSVTADKVYVTDLVAFDATIGGFKITDNSIYSGVKASVDNTTPGVYLDKDGQVAFGDADNYIKYYKADDENFNLEIAAKSLVLGASRKNIEEVVESIQDTVDSSAVTFIGEYVRTTTDEVVYFIKDEETGIITYFCEVVEVTDDATTSTIYQVTESDGVYTNTGITASYSIEDGEMLETTPEAPYKQGDIWITAGGYSVYCIVGSDDIFNEEDWTDSVEDLVESVEGASINIKNATDTASNAQTTADQAIISLEAANSRIQVLEDRLRSFVINENGGTLMDQDADSFSWNFVNNSKDIENIANDVVDLLNKMDKTEEIDEIFSYMRLIKSIELDGRELPCLELGDSDSSFKIQITNETVRFIDENTGYYNTTDTYTVQNHPVAYVNTDTMHVSNVTIDNRMVIGGLSWSVRQNGNVGILWKGVD